MSMGLFLNLWNVRKLDSSYSFESLKYTKEINSSISVVAQLCLTLCDPMECSPPGSSVHGILQARILEWVAIPFCRGSSPLRNWIQVSHIAGRFFTPWATQEAQQIASFESESESLSVLFDCLQPHGLYSPWNSPGQNTGVGSLSPLQGLFPTQGSNPGLLHCRWIFTSWATRKVTFPWGHQQSDTTEHPLKRVNFMVCGLNLL